MAYAQAETNNVFDYCGCFVCSKKQVWRPSVRIWGLLEAMYCIEESTCDIVGTSAFPQSFGAHRSDSAPTVVIRRPIVIRHQGNCAPLPPLDTPLAVRASYRQIKWHWKNLSTDRNWAANFLFSRESWCLVSISFNSPPLQTPTAGVYRRERGYFYLACCCDQIRGAGTHISGYGSTIWKFLAPDPINQKQRSLLESNDAFVPRLPRLDGRRVVARADISPYVSAARPAP